MRNVREVRETRETRDGGRQYRQRGRGSVVGVVGEAEVVALTDLARTARVRRVPFGFPSAVAPDEDNDAAVTDGTERAPIKLGDVVARQPATTFYVRMMCDALLDSGIYAGDVLVVDRMLRPHYGALAVVTLGDRDGLHARDGLADALDPRDGPLLVRHYCPDRAAIHLLPAHPHITPISVPVSMSVSGRTHQQAHVHVCGVVVGIVAGGRRASR